MLFWRKRKKRTYENTPKIVLIKQALIGIMIVGSLLLLGSGIWYGTRIDTLTVSSITVTGGETIAHEEIHRITEEKLSGSYFKLIPHRFVWTYPESAITASIEALERIKTVHLFRSGTELMISFSEYHPASLWCTTVDSTDCLFLDERGYAFGNAPTLTGSAFIRYSDPRRQPEIGTFAFDSETQTKLLQFADIAEERFGLSIFHIEQSGLQEITYYIGGGGALKVTQRIPLEETLRNLETILTSAEFEHLKPGNFQYIDLRYGDKVFVNEETSYGTDTAAAVLSEEHIKSEEAAAANVEEVQE